MKTKRGAFLGVTAFAALLAAMPQTVSAQVVGIYQRPGAASNAAPVRGVVLPPTGSGLMHSGAIERGGLPGYSYNRGNFSNGSSNFGQLPTRQYAPVMVLPEAPPLPAPMARFETHQQTYSNWTNTTPDYPRSNYLPPVGPANGFFNNLTPPVGPANGFGQPPSAPERRHRGDWNGGYVYGPSDSYPVIVNAPPLLGGYYYGGYSSDYLPDTTYPSVYSIYSGFPQYIYSPGVVVINQPDTLVYTTPYLPFAAPIYQTVYNQNTYYVGSEARVQALESGGLQAKATLPDAYPANSFQAAFADISHAWTDKNLTLLRRHLRDKDTRISVSLNSKYSYSIASGDFSDMTRDALDRLQTVSFDFTRLRKAKNGDVTAYGVHVYRSADDTTAGTNGSEGSTVPFDQSGPDTSASPYNQDSSPAQGAEKTVYVSYTLRRHDGEWYIVATDSANHDLAGDSR